VLKYIGIRKSSAKGGRGFDGGRRDLAKSARTESTTLTGLLHTSTRPLHPPHRDTSKLDPSRLTSDLVSCMACSMTGMILPSSIATHSSAPGLTSPSIAFNAATFVRHPFASSSVLHRVSKTILDASAGQILIKEFMTVFTALRTGWPLSIANVNKAGTRGRKTPSTPVPRDRHIRSTKTGPDSLSKPEVELDQARTTSMMAPSCIASKFRGAFFKDKAMESATAFASTLEGAVARARSSGAKGEGASVVVGFGAAATGDMLETAEVTE